MTELAFSVGWALFLDVDGTLLHLAEHPDDVEARPELLDLLGELGRLTGGALALVSGRGLDALDDIFAPLRLAAAGQHGHERRDACGETHRQLHDETSLESARTRLARFVEAHPGTHVEDKGASVALHYRTAPGAEEEALSLRETLEASLPESLLVQPGKMVLEVKPRGSSKGAAIAAFMREPPFAGRIAVFVGDDVTDEDGFRWVEANGGISIKVGGGPTAARFALSGVDGVLAWLRGYRDYLKRGADPKEEEAVLHE